MRRALALGLLALAGCGGGSGAGGDGGDAGSGAASAIVDPAGGSPAVNSLEVEPGTGDLLITTNRGFFHIDPEGGAPRPIRGTVSARGRTAPVGGFLEVLPVGRQTLLGSGHPDRGGALPQFLGVLRSEDGGRTWTVLSRLGEADLHRMAERHGKLYAFDAVLGAVLVSGDGGRTFEEKVAPPEPMVELEVDPSDPRRLLLASEGTIFRSVDGGESWRPLLRDDGARLAWPAPEALYRAERSGGVSVSGDGGDSWRPVGRLPGEPARLKAVDTGHLYVALATGAIFGSGDGGRSWKPVFGA